MLAEHDNRIIYSHLKLYTLVWVAVKINSAVFSLVTLFFLWLVRVSQFSENPGFLDVTCASLWVRVW